MVTTNNRQLCVSPLQKQNDTYAIDFEHLEKQFQQGVKLMLLCSPHNPIGRVWTKEELTSLDLYVQNIMPIVVADENSFR